MKPFLTTKQIAQAYVLNDIVVHELILEAFNEIEVVATQLQLFMTEYDIINQICHLSRQNDLYVFFGIDNTDILRTIKAEYQLELINLAKQLQKNAQAASINQSQITI
jgi:hypothetical protein